ncbi:Uncharacterised protein [Enterobacter cloacae]|nr:Uncharacterised protein [Enterobacter cloacae]
MGGIEDADLRLFIRDDGSHQLHAHRFQRGTNVAEIVFNHPLNKAFPHNRGVIVYARPGLNARREIGRRTRCDAIHHGIRTGRISAQPFDDPLFAAEG